MNSIDKDIVLNIALLHKVVNKYSFKNNYKLPYIDNCFNDNKDMTLKSRQLDILYLIIANNLNTVSEISNELELSKSSLSITISKMANQELLEKVYDHSDDARHVILKETEKGRNLYNNLKTFFINELTKFFMSLNEEEKQIHKSAMQYLNVAFYSFGVKNIDYDNSTDEEILSILFENIFILKKPLEKLHRQVKNNLKDKLALTEKEMDILRFIFEFDKSTPSELAGILFSSESTISSQLKPLVKNGYLVKEKSSEDSRKTYFKITSLGIDTLNECKNLLDSQFTLIISKFSIEDKKNILEGTSRLIDLFELLTQN